MFHALLGHVILMISIIMIKYHYNAVPYLFASIIDYLFLTIDAWTINYLFNGLFRSLHSCPILHFSHLFPLLRSFPLIAQYSLESDDAT